jgi:hypothetical protein
MTTVKVTVLNPETLTQLNNKPLQAGLHAALAKAKEVVEAKFTNNPADWVPLAQYTILDRRRQGYGPTPILYRTGHLKGVAVQQMQVEGNTGTISTSDPIAVKQNNGAGKIPARPFYNLSDTDKKVIIEAFKSGIKGK